MLLLEHFFALTIMFFQCSCCFYIFCRFYFALCFTVVFFLSSFLVVSLVLFLLLSLFFAFLDCIFYHLHYSLIFFRFILFARSVKDDRQASRYPYITSLLTTTISLTFTSTSTATGILALTS